MGGRSFQAKLIYLLIGVLVLLQTVTLAAIHFSGLRSQHRDLVDQLHLGGAVFDQVLAARARQLSESLRVLARDFGFREAVAKGDRSTVVDVLSNHGSRIKAEAAFLIALDGTVTADTLPRSLIGKPFPFPSLVGSAEENGEAPSIVSLDGEPFQLVIAPVLAPRAIAWVCMGFQINEGVLDDFKRITSLDISLSTAGSNPRLLSSTLRAALHDDLLGQVALHAGSKAGSETAFKIGTDSYETLIEPLRTADGSRIVTLIQRSLEDARRSARELELQIVVASTLALVMAILATMYFARGVI